MIFWLEIISFQIIVLTIYNPHQNMYVQYLSVILSIL